MRLTAPRTRRRLLETSKLTWNGTTLSGDIWPGIEKDLEELKLGAESQSKVETSIRYNFAKELGSASSTHRVGVSGVASQYFLYVR
jgi:hypothetical protein